MHIAGHEDLGKLIISLQVLEFSPALEEFIKRLVALAKVVDGL